MWNSDALYENTHPADTVTLNEVVVKPKKEKYSKKNNPAVDLMRRVREEHGALNPVKSDLYNYDGYDKIVIALNDYTGYIDEMTQNSYVSSDIKRRVFTSLIDTAIWTGKRVLDLSLKEMATTRLYANHGDTKKMVIRARKSNGLDKRFDENITGAFFEDALREIDIYNGEIDVIRSNFVSPLSAIAFDYYKFSIEDTLLIGSDRCYEVVFTPKTAEALGFNGRLFIPVEDSIKYVKRAFLRLPKVANVNYIESLILSQTYSKDSVGNVHKTLDDMIVELKIAPRTPSFFISRQSRYDNFSYEPRSDLDEYMEKVGYRLEVPGYAKKSKEYWDNIRMIPLTYAECNMSIKDSPFRAIPALKIAETVIQYLVEGYVPTGKNSKFDFGPIDTFIGYNKLEGLRLAVGGATTANLCKNLFASGYVAYGFRDSKFLYNGALEYSFNKKRYWRNEFPVNAIRASYTYDVNELGEHFLSHSTQSLLSYFRRKYSELTTYHRVEKLEYEIEWRNHLSFIARLQHESEEASRYVHFIDGFGNLDSHYNVSSLKLQLRYAHNEKFVQMASTRHNINREGFIFMLSHEFGPKGFLGSKYTVNVTEAMIQKRFSFSAFGYMDILIKGGKIWNQVQFPALFWQNANTSYTTKTETYSLLNPMELAMDEYASWDMTYFLNGLILNRIPLIKKLKLREIVSFKGFAGHLTRKNNPLYNDNLYRFPSLGTMAMGNTPYMEIGVGLDNILTFLRIDYIWRLTYRNIAGAPNSGLRVSFHFSL
jgi:hypothetical protein